jgi:hypothetical protein
MTIKDWNMHICVKANIVFITTSSCIVFIIRYLFIIQDIARWILVQRLLLQTEIIHGLFQHLLTAVPPWKCWNNILM